MNTWSTRAVVDTQFKSTVSVRVTARDTSNPEGALPLTGLVVVLIVVPMTFKLDGEQPVTTGFRNRTPVVVAAGLSRLPRIRTEALNAPSV